MRELRVVDDFLPTKEFKLIEDIFLNDAGPVWFPWYFADYVGVRNPEKHSDGFYFMHNFYDSNNNVYCIEGSRLKNNSIYRCYFNNNKWIAREERPDKKYPNSKNIIEIIQNQINFKMNLHTHTHTHTHNSIPAPTKGTFERTLT